MVKTVLNEIGPDVSQSANGLSLTLTPQLPFLARPPSLFVAGRINGAEKHSTFFVTFHDTYLASLVTVAAPGRESDRERERERGRERELLLTAIHGQWSLLREKGNTETSRWNCV